MNFEAVAKETFQVLRSYEYEVVLYDDEGNQVFEPNEARRLFASPENLLVSIVEDSEDSNIRLYLSKSTDIESVLGLVDSLRAMATKYNMTFHVRKYERVLSPKDFSTKSSVTENQRKPMKPTEYMYGTSRASYLKLENARLILRHSRPIVEEIVGQSGADEEELGQATDEKEVADATNSSTDESFNPGARGQHIAQIFVEDSEGQREEFPTNNFDAARAMAHHLDAGGGWADEVGSHIKSIALDFENLASISKHVYLLGGELSEPAHRLRFRVREAMKATKRMFEGVSANYAVAARAIMETRQRVPNSKMMERAASLLNTEATKLSESALTSAAKVLENMDAQLREAQKPDMIGVLGMKVHKDAWQDLLQGKLAVRDLSKIKDIESRQTGDSSSASGLKMGAIASSCTDDSLANLFAYIADNRATAKGDLLDKMNRICAAVFKIVGRMTNQTTSPVAAMESVRELQKWIATFRTSGSLSEDYGYDPQNYDHRGEAAKDNLLNSFDVNAFLSSKSADDLNFPQRLQLNDEERELEKSTVMGALVHYLRTEMENEDVDGYDMSREAMDIYPEVEQTLKEAGYTIDGDNTSVSETEDHMETSDGPELSREDILLPKNQGQDLIDEIEPDHSDAYVSRMQSLAGVTR